MTDEEKKALEILKDREYDFDELYCTFRQSFIKPYDKSIGIILELIEKQSKEIEELKEDLKKKPTFLIKDIYSPKIKEISLQDAEGLIEQGKEEVRDKIKAKIEENKWAIEHYDCDEADYKQSQAVGAWNVLQRLLKEKE